VKKLLLASAALATLGLGLTGCSDSPVDAADAYQVACPLVDATIAGGSVTNRAALAGLKALRDSRQLAAESQQWLESAITVLESANPEDLPADVRQRVVDGCAEHGHPLRNLR
jgi:hypothetical protein